MATESVVKTVGFHEQERIYELAYMADGIVAMMGAAAESGLQTSDDSLDAACMAVHTMLREIKQISGFTSGGEGKV